MEELYTTLEKYIDIPYLIVFMMLSYAFKGSLTNALSSLFKTKVKKVFSVFLIGTITGVFFVMSLKTDFLKSIITWSVGTSMHELIFSYIEKRFFPEKIKNLPPDTKKPNAEN
jgi:ribosomal protein L23